MDYLENVTKEAVLY